MSSSPSTYQFLLVVYGLNEQRLVGHYETSTPPSASIADFVDQVMARRYPVNINVPEIWKFQTPLSKSSAKEFVVSGALEHFPCGPLASFDSPLTVGNVTVEYIANWAKSLSECWDTYLPDAVHFIVVAPLMTAPAVVAPVEDQTAEIRTELVTKYRSIFLTVSTFGSWVTSDLGDFEASLADESRLASNQDAVPTITAASTEEHPQPDSGHDSMPMDTDLPSPNQQGASSQRPSTPSSGEGPSQNPLALYCIKSLEMPWERYWDRVHSTLGFKQQLVNALFFLPLLPYFPNGSPLRVHMNKSSWPFHVIMERDRTGMPAETRVEFQSHLPRSDFCVTRGLLPRMAVEISPTPWPKRTDGQSAVYPYDLTRMLLSGAFVVRLANGFLNDFKEEKKFIFTCIYVAPDRYVHWYTLFQQADRPEVFYSEKVISSEKGAGRAEVLLRLFNLVDYLGALKEQDGEISKAVKDLQERYGKHQKEFPIPTFTKNSPHNKKTSKRRRTGDGGESGSTRARNRSTNGGANDCGELIAHGYEAEFETELPPHLYTVHYTSKPSAQLVAKRVPRDSDEITILEFVGTLKVQSEHIIPLLDSFRGESGYTWAVFPKIAKTLEGCLDDEPRWLTSHVPSVCQGLIEGVAYLHQHNIAHRDLKPANLVVDNDYVLKIIDFGLAIRVRDEDDEVSDYCGTDGWMAPEIEEEPLRPYSPIKADRWSCGCVILHLLDRVHVPNSIFQAIAKRLKSTSPKKRPSLASCDPAHWEQPLQCNYTYDFTTVREFVDFCHKLTRWGEAGVYGFIEHLNSRAAATLLVQSITVEARQEMAFRQLEGLSPMPESFSTGITQSMAWSLLSRYLTSCPSENPRIEWPIFPALNITGINSAFDNSSQAALTTNRTISTPGQSVTLSWELPGRTVSYNSSYITTGSTSEPRFAAWISQLNTTYTPLEDVNGTFATTRQPNATLFPDSVQQVVNSTMFIVIIDADIHVSPWNLSAINDHIVAGPAVYIAG